MIKYIFLLTLISLMILYCDQNTTTQVPDTRDIYYLSFVDVPCYEGASYRILSQDSILNNWELRGDTLHLDCKWLSNCASAYKDSVSIANRAIAIFLTDTATWHARCMCPHTSMFIFKIENTDYINLRLQTRWYVSNEYTTILDTLLNLE
jgi:hypothetical protein